MPLITKMSPNVVSIAPYARAAEDAGSDALAITNSYPAMAIDIETRRPKLANVTGGLTGPAIKPIAVKLVWEAAQEVVSPKHRLARRKEVSISELAEETFIAHNVVSPYRDVVLREFQRRRVPLNMPVEMPTIETIRKLVQNNEGVAFLPRMCVEQEIEQRLLCAVKVKELHVERKIRLIYPTRRALSHAAKAFLEVVRGK